MHALPSPITSVSQQKQNPNLVKFSYFNNLDFCIVNLVLQFVFDEIVCLLLLLV